MCALTSSPLSWTGRGTAFTIVGYSLGGGIAATFTSYFPFLVSHVVMLAPGGLIRDDRISWKSKVLYQTEGYLPERLIEWMVGRRLGKGQNSREESTKPSKLVVRTKSKRATRESDGMVQDDGNVSVQESKTLKVSESPRPLLGSAYPNSTEAHITSWQLEHCKGFIPAFISCIRNAPIHHQHDRFRQVAKDFESWNASNPRRKQALLILGRRDPIVSEEEVVPDMTDCLGQHNLVVQILDAAHDIPIQRPREVANSMIALWKETGWN